MSLLISGAACFTVTLQDGRHIVLSEEDLQAAWSFASRNDIGEFINFLKWLAELGRRDSQ